MDYKSFINSITLLLSGTTVSGSTFIGYTEYCYESAIGLDKTMDLNKGAAAYITPIPITFDEAGLVNFSTKIFILAQLKDNDKNNLLDLHNSLFTFYSNFLYNLKSDRTFYESYPNEMIPHLVTDFDADGIAFTITSKHEYNCDLR